MGSGVPDPYPNWGGALVTDGGLVFYGSLGGDFRAVDRNSGKVLWSRKLGSGIVGNPITYKVDGNQYVSVYAGIGGWVGLPVAAGLDMNDKFGAIGATAIAKASGLNVIPSRRAARSTPLDSRPTRHEVRTPDKRFRVWSHSLPDAACSHATLT